MINEVNYSDEDMEVLLSCRNKFKKQKDADVVFHSFRQGMVSATCLLTFVTMISTPFVAMLIPIAITSMVLETVNSVRNHKLAKKFTDGKFTYKQYIKAQNSGEIDKWERENIPFIARVDLTKLKQEREKSFKYRKKSILATADFSKRRALIEDEEKQNQNNQEKSTTKNNELER